MEMGQLRAGAGRGSVALERGPCVPRQRPIKAARGGGLGQWSNSWPRSYECRMSSARNTSPPACSQRNLLFPGTSSPRTARSWAGLQGNHGQGSCSILALQRAMPASCACSHPVAQDVPARTRTARARDIHAHTHDAHARSHEHTGHGHAGACACREHTRPTDARRHKRTQAYRPARRARRKPGPRPRTAARTRPAHRQHWRRAASSRRPAARPPAPGPACRRRPPHSEDQPA